jgi:ABC-type branched-subunit amino acid transport system substrate-binding protein
MRRAKWWAILMALVLVAAACGGDDDDDTSTEADTETEAEAEDESSDTSADEAEDEDATGSEAPTEVTTDIGVDDEVIRIGYNADLSGIFAPLVIQIIDSTEAYWENVNENGGIAGRMVEPVVLDNGYDVPKHLENYEVMSGDGSESVVMIGQSTGSPHTAATAALLVEDDLIAIPLSWYSGWADPEFGANVFEVQTSYCIESMNGMTYMSENFGENVAIISFPGEYGQDGAQGAKKTAEALGLTVVYDGEGAVVPEADQTPVINEIVNSGADFVWATINPTTLSQIMGGAVQQGYTGMWSGNSPTYNFQLLGTDLAPALDQYYVHSTYTSLWNTDDTPGMTEVVEQMRARRPDAPISDVYLIGWINGIIVQTILEQAAANGDMTRAGVVAAASEVTVDLKGLAPNQTWGGEPNDNLVRESYIYDVDSSLFTGDLTVSDEDASTGFSLIEGPFASPTAEEYVFDGPCFVAE